MIDVIEVLTKEGEAIIDDAAAALERTNLRHYAEAGPALTRERLTQLLALVLDCVTTRDLVPMIDYSTTVAHERFCRRLRHPRGADRVQCAGRGDLDQSGRSRRTTRPRPVDRAGRHGARPGSRRARVRLRVTGNAPARPVAEPHRPLPRRPLTQGPSPATSRGVCGSVEPPRSRFTLFRHALAPPSSPW